MKAHPELSYRCGSLAWCHVAAGARGCSFFIVFMRALLHYEIMNRPYDFNGVLHLVPWLRVKYLRTNAIDQDLLEFAHSITDDQAAFMQRLLDSRAQSIAEFEKEA